MDYEGGVAQQSGLNVYLVEEAQKVIQVFAEGVNYGSS